MKSQHSQLLPNVSFNMNASLSSSCLCRGTGNDSECGLDLFQRHGWFDILATFAPYALITDRTVSPVWYVLGIGGNAVSFKIWSQRCMRRKNSAANYLAALALSDLCFLLLHVIMEMKIAWGIGTIDFPVVCETFMVCYYTFQYLLPFLVLGFTIERFIAVCFPFRVARYSTGAQAMRNICISISIAFSLCSLQGYLWYYNIETSQCEMRPEALQGDELSFEKIWTWMTEMAVFALIPLLILCLNVSVVRIIWKVSLEGPVSTSFMQLTRKSAATNGMPTSTEAKAASTVMLLSVSFFVIFTTLPATLVYAMHSLILLGNTCLSDSEINGDQTWQTYFTYITARKIIEEICLSQHACNIIIYYLTGTKFRRQLKQLLREKKSHVFIFRGRFQRIRNSNDNTRGKTLGSTTQSTKV